MKENQTITLIPVLIEDLGMMFPAESSKEKKRFGRYKCQCGAEFKTQTAGVKNGHTQSCGCYNKQVRNTHGMTNHRLFPTWGQIIQRTSNPKHKQYEDYGARGIKVCDRWKDIHNFIEDMYPSFKEGLSIDRIDNNKGYSPDNCRWASKTTQSCNTRTIRSNNKSGYRGVSFNKVNNKWESGIMTSLKKVHLGYFNTPLEAAKAYDRFVIENKLEHTMNGVL